MSSTCVIVTEPGKAKQMLKSLGTTIVRVTSSTPCPIRMNGEFPTQTRFMFTLDIDALTPEQLDNLIKQKANEWFCGMDEARRTISELGFSILIEHCRLLQPPQPLRPARLGEYEVPNDAEPDCCHSCSAPILWIRTLNNKFMPISVATLEQDLGGRRFGLSHFTDCPNAKQHRKPRR